MEYTGKFRTMYSDTFDEEVDILEYRSKDKHPYCNCDRCGKPITKIMFVVQSSETALEHMYLGSECIKHLR